jgi:hypothetical protein
MKRCKGEDCKKELPLDAFSGRSAVCKVCRNAKAKRKRDADKQDKDKVCTGCDKLLPGKSFNKGWSECKVCQAERRKQLRQADKQDKDKVCTGKCGKLLPGDKFPKGKNYCKECEAEYNKIRYDADKQDKPKVCTGKDSCGKLLPGKDFDKGKNFCKECHKKRLRTPEYRETINARKRKRLKEDPQFRHQCRLRHLVRRSFKGTQKDEHTEQCLGCTFQESHNWKEAQFLPGMSLDHKNVVMDHMISLRSFDLSDPEERRKSCHYTNLQPLWAKDNGAKSDKEIYDMEWRDDQWYIKLGDEYMSRKVQVKKGISTHDYYPISTFYL